MNAVVRHGQLALAAALVAASVSVACGPRDGRAPVGTSDRARPHGTIAEAEDAGLVDGASVLPQDYRTTFTKLTASRFVSKGHAPGRWNVEVYANALAASALASGARQVPVGATIIEEHYERAEGDARGPIMVMEKREHGYAPEHGDWRWIVVASSGMVALDGTSEQCAGCHDDAPAGGLFPILSEP